MGLVQYIFTSILVEELSAQNAFDTSSMSVRVCQHYGITGRVFANRNQALVITEGPKETVEHYFQSIQKDPMTGTQILHSQKEIREREFNDYSVWLNLGQGFEFSGDVRELSQETLPLAWPENLSAKVRIMADAYLDSDMLAPY